MVIVDSGKRFEYNIIIAYLPAIVVRVSQQREDFFDLFA